ncbi:hypothetical protein Nepgr_003020 [Nepenthes gracilis]|uniref:Uncharacterized protein n=1 Tax=Nepenthes gracilis TaxID=150966 RepID=A0AAD3RYR4_NEPGR|nr:hypothetical protein Nepgr_003020 [Nepenthes gracilis]
MLQRREVLGFLRRGSEVPSLLAWKESVLLFGWEKTSGKLVPSVKTVFQLSSSGDAIVAAAEWPFLLVVVCRIGAATPDLSPWALGLRE